MNLGIFTFTDSTKSKLENSNFNNSLVSYINLPGAESNISRYSKIKDDKIKQQFSPTTDKKPHNNNTSKNNNYQSNQWLMFCISKFESFRRVEFKYLSFGLVCFKK